MISIFLPINAYDWAEGVFRTKTENRFDDNLSRLHATPVGGLLDQSRGVGFVTDQGLPEVLFRLCSGREEPLILLKRG